MNHKTSRAKEHPVYLETWLELLWKECTCTDTSQTSQHWGITAKVLFYMWKTRLKVKILHLLCHFILFVLVVYIFYTIKRHVNVPLLILSWPILFLISNEIKSVP